MKDYFKGFYRPTKREFQKMWSNAYFVFDTNVLINPFRFQSIAREVILEVLMKLRNQNRLWIPHQVGLEYHHNINEEIYKQDSAYQELEDSIRSLGTDLENVYKRISLKHSTLILNDHIQSKFNDILDELIQEIKKQKEQHPDYDKLKLKIAEIFKGNVGEPYSQEQLNELYIEGENRFENSVPPGYKDIDKGDAKRYFDGLDYTKKYGDLVLWKQIIDFAKSKKTDIIFVTDDNKEDWWLISHGKTLGPHPEIIQEFKRETDGNNIYIYKTKQFLESCKDSETFLIPSARIDKAIDSINQYKKSVKDNEEALNAQLQKEKLEFEEELKKEIKMKSLGLSSEYLKEYNKKTKFNFLRTYQITALVDKDVNDSYRLLSKRIVNTHSKLYNYEPYSVRIAGQGNIGSSSDVLKINIKSPEEIHTNLFKKLLNDSCDVKTIYILEMKEISIEDLNEFAFTETNLHE